MGQPVLSWSLQLFEQTPEVTEIIIAARPEDMDEINAFLAKHHITKVDLVFAGYEALKAEYGPKDKQNKE